MIDGNIVEIVFRGAQESDSGAPGWVRYEVPFWVVGTRLSGANDGASRRL
jgi:hypothetical protein